MIRYLVVALTMVTLAALSNQVQAEKNWWQQGVSIYKSIQQPSSSPSIDEISSAFQEALKIGTQNVVSQLGKADGFNADPAVHIPLPDKLQTVRSLLDTVQMAYLVDDIELKLNRAVEHATPQAKELFWQAIKEMTFDDVKKIYDGPKDSATQYFQEKMTPSLKDAMRPIVENSLAQVGTIAAYDKAIGQYKSLPFVPDVKADLTEHALQKGLEGVFYYVAKEEEAIRTDPIRQTTDLLKKVFSKKK